jgi:hypothetical protein
VGVSVGINGNVTFVNHGTAGSVSLSTNEGTALLTSFAASRIVGSIGLGGSTRMLEFVGGNFAYMANSLAGVTIDTHGAPFAVSGTTVAVVDPTSFATAATALNDFARRPRNSSST